MFEFCRNALDGSGRQQKMLTELRIEASKWALSWRWVKYPDSDPGRTQSREYKERIFLFKIRLRHLI